MNPLLIGIVGSRNTGKTTFTLDCCKLLDEIGKTVLVIKFSSSHYSIDPDGKDSALFRTSNINTVIFSSPFETVTYQKVTSRSSLDEIRKLIPDDIDIVLCESYPSTYPKIPLIYVVRSDTDFEETKLRYSLQEPIFVIKSSSTEKDDYFIKKNTFSITNMEEKKEIRYRLLQLLNKNIG
ncbi:MAG: molybdopterin-guanine dinucleotide biosynthesis protein B [Candidatus Hodarchaeales archaeon]|jgi:molybdopterin-guanine dinucleotide biosynthesis protein MobB